MIGNKKLNLPQGWTLTSLGMVANYINGRAFKPTEWQNEGKPIIRIQNLNNHMAKFNFSPLKHEEKYIVKTGDLLFAWSASLGAYIWHGQEAWLNQHIFKVLPYRCVDKKFLYYLLTDVTANLYAKSHGSGMVHVTKGKFESTEIVIPPLPEQHRIVAKIEALFSELDKGIESFKTAREQLKVYRQALLKHAFSGKLTAQWRAENQDKLETAEALLQRIQTEREQRYQQQLKDWEEKSPSIPLLQRGKPSHAQPEVPPFVKGGLGGISKPKAPKTLPPLTAEELAELPELPEGWTYSRLGALIDEPTYGTAKKCDYETIGTGVLRIPNVASGKIDASDLKFAHFNDDEIVAYKLNEGDILLIRSNGSISIVGRCALVSGYDTEYLYAGYLIMLRPNQRLIAPAYLLNQVSAHSVRKQVEQKAKSTSGVNNINSGEIQSLIIAVCGVEEQSKIQTEIELRLSIIDQLEQTMISSLEQAEALRQSILKKAFSGQLVPQDPNDEPASVLLERIQAEKADLVTPKKIKGKRQKTTVVKVEDKLDYLQSRKSNGKKRMIQ